MVTAPQQLGYVDLLDLLYRCGAVTLVYCAAVVLLTIEPGRLSSAKHFTRLVPSEFVAYAAGNISCIQRGNYGNVTSVVVESMEANGTSFITLIGEGMCVVMVKIRVK